MGESGGGGEEGGNIWCGCDFFGREHKGGGDILKF